MSVEVRPIHLPGAAALGRLRQRAHAALAAWGQQWLDGAGVRGENGGEVRLGELGVVALGPTDRPPEGAYRCVRTQAGRMWFRAEASDHHRLGLAVVGATLMPDADGTDAWIAEVIERARLARNRALCTAWLGEPADPGTLVQAGNLPAELFAIGSGAVALCCEALGLQAVADKAVWKSMPPVERGAAHRLPGLTPLDRAMRRAMGRLDVLLGSVDIDLPRLLDLRRGDVLRLPQRLDRPLALCCEGRPLARVALGARQGRKCVQVVPDPPHS